MKMSCPKSKFNRIREAFSLVEMLVVIAILGIMFTFLFPALQSSRERARIVSCQSNLRQIALGGIQFEVARRRFPPAMIGHDVVRFEDLWTENHRSSWRNRQFVTALGVILPMLELGSLADGVHSIAFDLNQHLDQLRNENGTRRFASCLEISGLRELASTSVSLFQCPSDVEEPSDGIILMQPVWTTDHHSTTYRYASDFGFDSPPAKTNYSGNYCAISSLDQLGMRISSDHYGITSSGKKVQMRDVRDGLSKTVFFGESLGSIDDDGIAKAKSWLLAGVAMGTGAAYWPSGRRFDEYLGYPTLGHVRSSAPMSFGSAHFETVSFVFGDGHVDLISRDIDVTILVALCGRANES